MTAPGRRWRWPLVALALVVALALLAHPVIVATTRLSPPAVSLPDLAVRVDAKDGGVRRVGASWATRRGKILEVLLAGSPEEIGASHTRLLREEMLENEAALWTDFERKVSSPIARALLLDLGRLRFREVDRGMTDAHRREIAAGALAFAPDPWDGDVATYQRMVYLHSLYDISLSFERSPLIGCTSFALTGDAAEDGHTLLARAFDFEAGDVFDTGKALFLVREAGRIPYASVAWPGLVGVVSGMNAEGLALVVHGARAREPRSAGEPVVHTMRDVLALAHDVGEAAKLLGERPAMVSHLVFLADAKGDVAVVERAPGEAPFVRRGARKVPLTNHFEGPLASDPKNERIRRETSTLARRARLDELLAALPERAGAAEAIAVLRDKRAAGGGALPPGDRRAIDALIATHGVVFDVSGRVAWVSEGPHLSGRFLRFDVGRMLAPGYDPSGEHAVTAIAADEAAKP